MSSFQRRPPTSGDAAAVAELVIAYERALYGKTEYSLGDLRAEWETLDLVRDALVLLDRERIVAFGSLEDRGELWRIDAYVHPEELGRGLGTELVGALEAAAASRGARRIQSGVAEPDEAGHRLLATLGYRRVRVFRELRIDLDAEPQPPRWPEGLVPDEFDAERDAAAFHAAQQEAFADHWEHRPLELARWRELNVDTERFDPSLWRIVRAGDEIGGGVICEADRYGGGWVAVLFTRRSWRGRGVGRALLLDAFQKFRDRGERSVGLGVDAENATGAFQLYENVGMRPVMGWVMHEKELAP
ncbi:MAG: GNAT family N-acetyltransferase [Gaiellaceae bacterium]|jgi:mycothiol synthase